MGHRKVRMTMSSELLDVQIEIYGGQTFHLSGPAEKMRAAVEQRLRDLGLGTGPALLVYEVYHFYPRGMEALYRAGENYTTSEAVGRIMVVRPGLLIDDDTVEEAVYGGEDDTSPYRGVFGVCPACGSKLGPLDWTDVQQIRHDYRRCPRCRRLVSPARLGYVVEEAQSPVAWRVNEAIEEATS